MHLGYGKRIIAHRGAIRRVCDVVLKALPDFEQSWRTRGAQSFGMLNDILPDEAHWIYQQDARHCDQIVITDPDHMRRVHEDIAIALDKESEAELDSAARHIGELRQMSWLSELVARDQTLPGHHSLDIDPLSLRLSAIAAWAYAEHLSQSPSSQMNFGFFDVSRVLSVGTEQQLSWVSALIKDVIGTQHLAYEQQCALHIEAVAEKSDSESLLRIAIDIDSGTINATATLSGQVQEITSTAIRLATQPPIYSVVGSDHMPLHALISHPLTNGLGLLSIGGSSHFEAQAGRYLLKHNASLCDRRIITI